MCVRHTCACVCVSDKVGVGLMRMVTSILPQYHYLRGMPCRERHAGRVQAELGRWGPSLPLCHCGVVGGSGTLEVGLVQMPTLTLACCVTLGKCLNLSGSSLPHQDDNLIPIVVGTRET